MTVAGEINLACSQVWGGRSRVDQLVRLPGARASVYSEPHGGDAQGGDIQYLGSCHMGALAKVVLADASGHGARAAEIAEMVERGLEASINESRNDRFLSLLNEALKGNDLSGQFATMISLILNSVDGRLRFASAAHPFMAHYDRESGRWHALDVYEHGSLPLGILDDVSYYESDRALSPGDLLVLFSDGVIELGARSGRHLGVAGLINWLGEAPVDGGPEAVKDFLVERMRAFANGGDFDDDVTLLVIQYDGQPAMA